MCLTLLLQKFICSENSCAKTTFFFSSPKKRTTNLEPMQANSIHPSYSRVLLACSTNPEDMN
jgi:hypothetical protein